MHIRLYVLQHKITLRNFNGMYNYKNNSPKIKNRNHLYLRDKMLRIET